MKVLILLGLIAHALAAPDQYIVGGVPASANEWPWQVGWLNGGSFSCGAVVVHQNWILTAGHCVGGPVGLYTVELGSITRGQGTVVDVSTVVRHPEYNNGLGFTPNDVAVVGAAVPINSDSIVAVSGIDTGIDRTTQTCFITGWGRTCGSCALPITLQEAQIPVISDDLCRSEHGISFQPEVHICVFDQVDQDNGACNGDSGGPLVCRASDAASWDLIGVTSWGSSGCPTTNPSVYTRLSTYRAWICTETNGAVAC